MSEQEKKAIEYLKARLYGNEGCELIDVAQSDLRIIIKLVDRVLKADKNWQEIYDDQEENIREKNNKICEFEFIIENQQKELNTLKEIEQLHKEENGKLRVELEQEKEKNEKLMEELDLTTVYISGVYDGEKKWKDKIKEKIVEIINSSARYNVLCKINENEETRKTRYAVAVLKELLEEV